MSCLVSVSVFLSLAFLPRHEKKFAAIFWWGGGGENRNETNTNTNTNTKRNGGTAYEEFPGLKSAVRVQECISVLGDNPVAKRLGNFALSSLNPVFEGQSRDRAKKRLQGAASSVGDVGEGGGGGGGNGKGKGSMKFPPLKVRAFCLSFFKSPGGWWVSVAVSRRRRY